MMLKHLIPYKAVNDAVKRWQQSRKLPEYVLPKYVYMSKTILDMDDRMDLPKEFGPPMLGGCLIKVDRRLRDPICYVKDGPMRNWKTGEELPEGWVPDDDEPNEDDESNE